MSWIWLITIVYSSNSSYLSNQFILNCRNALSPYSWKFIRGEFVASLERAEVGWKVWIRANEYCRSLPAMRKKGCFADSVQSDVHFCPSIRFRLRRSAFAVDSKMSQKKTWGAPPFHPDRRERRVEKEQNNHSGQYAFVFFCFSWYFLGPV